MMIQPTWTSTISDSPLSATVRFATDKLGVSRLQIGALVGQWKHELITRLDGTVENAVLVTDLGLCAFSRVSIYDDHYLFTVASNVYDNGALGGSPLGALPTFAMHFVGEQLHANRATTFGDIELDHQGRLILYPWDKGAPVPIWSDSQDPGFQEDMPIGSDDALFWTSSSSA